MRLYLLVLAPEEGPEHDRIGVSIDICYTSCNDEFEEVEEEQRIPISLSLKYFPYS